MASPVKTSSIKRTLLIMIVGLVTVALIISSYIIDSLYMGSAQKQLVSNTKSWANVISDQSVHYIKKNDHRSLEKQLKTLKSVPYLNYIHVYSLSDNTQQINFFTSYNRNSSFPPIPNKIDDINALSQPLISSNSIELIVPITNASDILGYLYIQSNLQNIDVINKSSLIVFFLVLGVAILFSLLIAFKVEHIITSPILALNDVIQEITHSKNYTLLCKDGSIKEFNMLSYNLNVLLKRVAKQINSLDISEQESVKLTQELEDKVNFRTQALKESNQELVSTLEKLHQFQDQLVENEKMASLGDMVAGVAHEVNTPIGLAVTSSTLLSDRLTEIKTLFDNKTLRSSQLKKFINDSLENTNLIYRNVTRAADLIASFKKVAVDQSNEDIRNFNINELIHEVLLSLKPQIKNTSYNININCPSELWISSKPGPITQILINLIMNSIIHGFENREFGEITITIMPLSRQLNIQYQDNGKGIDTAFQSKVFEPFTTTKRGSGGSGLGLHLVYNLVTQALSGNINLESAPEHGVLFDMNFPIDD